MRLAGRISNWNDDKGFGFVVPHDGGARAFVHIKAFQMSARRPTDGELISYEVTKDSNGRASATNIRFAGQKIERQKPYRHVPRLGIAVCFGAATLVGAATGLVPAGVAIAYLVASLVSYVMYCLDKAAAGRSTQRTPESTLHLIDVLGGWPGALVAQHRFRHKTVKASFQFAFWLTVLANLGVTAWLLYSGLGQSLAGTLFGG